MSAQREPGEAGPPGGRAGGTVTGPDIARVSTREVYRNRWLSLREDRIRLADGTDGIYSVVDKPDFALVIPAERDGFHLVEQYRYAVGGRFWEFPQGTGSAATPADLAREVLDALAATIAAPERVESWKAGDGTGGTEDLRQALRQYRGLVDRLLEI